MCDLFSEDYFLGVRFFTYPGDHGSDGRLCKLFLGKSLTEKQWVVYRRFGTPEDEKEGGGAGGSNCRRVSSGDAALGHALC